MSSGRWIIALLGLVVWASGLYVLVGGSYAAGGALIVAGGLLLVIAASGGWSEFWVGLTNWLYFWR